ncbi:MAG TPA: hypothetical protein VM680_12910 [Verrucomicrobiae bacterium]|nr:hypothetical protein [Verrucomicrobiae bacterium]
MKRTARASRKNERRAGINFDKNVFSLSNAKTYLGRLVDKAGNGDPVYIVRGQRRFILQEVKIIEPIPIRPPGFFNGIDTKAEIKEQNALAKFSVIPTPTDLE